MRAGGAGVPAFFTRAGVGTRVADGGLPWRYDESGSVLISSPPKEVRSFEVNGALHEFVLEEAIVADFAIVHAWRGDRHGNLQFRSSASNFNPLAAMCGRVTIAEVEQVVELGQIAPAQVHTPGVFVHKVLELTPEQAEERWVEKRTVRVRPSAEKASLPEHVLDNVPAGDEWRAAVLSTVTDGS
jgi:3-oxoacid CoA-transferase subunit A